jgi:ABC-type uncharacterized transport system fused permease/ATPase subunit
MKRWRQFWRIAAPYWISERRSLGLLVLLLLSISSSSLLIWETLQRGELLSALAAQDQQRFIKGVVLILSIIVFSIPALSLKSYVQDKLSINWRLWLTDRYCQQYFTEQIFYHIDSEEVDNPDQRIAEDIRNFTQQALNLLVILLDSIVQFAGFVAVLWFISKSLLAVLLTYAIAGTAIIAFIFGRTLIRMNAEQLKCEANFRYGLVRIRENAEAIAFYRGQTQEYQQVQRRFMSAFRNFNRLIRWQLNLTLFQNGYQYITFILPFMVLAPRLFSGELEIGVVSQSQAAFERVGLALGLIITQFDQLSAFFAGSDRLDRLSQAAADSLFKPSGIETVGDISIVLQQVTLTLPKTATMLICELSVAVTDQPLLIAGESGVGKSSLLRAIAGLWRSGSGQIVRPAAQQIMFLPQRPYMVLGSLRQQLLYPDRHPESQSDGQLIETLRQVDLAELLDRWGGLDAIADWTKLLSLGEQQRLAFARLLLAQPQYALLDEATSALDELAEAGLYTLLQTTSTTFISVGHRPSLLAYHQQVLELKSDQTWQVSTAANYSFGAFWHSGNGQDRATST